MDGYIFCIVGLAYYGYHVVTCVRIFFFFRLIFHSVYSITFSLSIHLSVDSWDSSNSIIELVIQISTCALAFNYFGYTLRSKVGGFILKFYFKHFEELPQYFSYIM